MRDTITQIIRSVFNLNSNQSLDMLKNDQEVKEIIGLEQLIQQLKEENPPPKLIAQAWERVILEIRMKDTPSSLEQKLLASQESVMNELTKQSSMPFLRSNDDGSGKKNSDFSGFAI